MQILLTGASSVLGRAAAEHLSAAGHQVASTTTQPGDRELHELTDAADAVVHLAPVEPGLPDSAGLTGLVRIANAAARSGTRLLLPIHAAGEPALYRQAEELVTSSWGPTLVIRLAPLAGRLPDWAVARTVATLQGTSHGAGGTVRVLHTDDLFRFLTHAVRTNRTGRVDLASTDEITWVSARRQLSDVAVPRRAAIWPLPDPAFSVDALQHDWAFECGWRTTDAIADSAAALARYLPAAGAPAQPVGGSDPAPEGLAGEFDYRIDTAYSRFDGTGTSDALPGPLTPLTLDVQVAALRSAQQVTAAAMGLPAPLAAEWADRATAVFGHRVFTGASIGAAIKPGLNTIRRMLALSRRYGAHCDAHADGVIAAQRGPATVATMSDAQLDVRILLLRNQIQRGWTLASLGVPIEGAYNRLARRPYTLIPQPAAMTATGHLAAQTAALADWLRTDTRLRELAAEGDLAGLRAASTPFAAAFDVAVQRVGHRGPGEAELANPVIADAPDQLLAAAALAAGDHPGTPTATASPPMSRADETRAARELAWDSTARATQQLRITLREKGSRLVSADVIDDPTDVLYLTCDELLAGPHDARARIARRRAERLRLENLTLPDSFDGQWTPVEDAGAGRSPTVIPVPVVTVPAPLRSSAGSPGGRTGTTGS